jgi:hypothetical protein
MTCPECGAQMRQTRRGATLRKRGPVFVCPRAEAEWTRDERGHFIRVPGGIHASIRSWQLEEARP